MINFCRLLKSFGYALRGISYAFKEEQNFRIQIVLTIIVLILAVYFRIRIIEAAVLTLAISGVLILELMNTIFERLTDVLKPRLNPYASAIKDLMAALVLISSLGALIIGLLIFVPRIKDLL